ncbi:MAG: hypothetical protein ACOH1T_06060 [Microbacteriaceae bacterium]
MFLDSDDRQLPLLMPADVPRRPGVREAQGFGRFIADLVADCEAATIAITFERRGNDTITPIDVEWFRLARDACEAAEVTLRGPMLCYGGGVRWVAAEDYAL